MGRRENTRVGARERICEERECGILSLADEKTFRSHVFLSFLIAFTFIAFLKITLSIKIS